ncbi:hypothetical protein GGI19_000088 [Coemansia pectinata]|uniref:C2H2-type domain-containing protein n=1 Tax=Coemansia pectinata TaxID=1052879 RepID=A0A9W8H4P4_9FUNG|nr:hypothetical protein GGI19_000088 [Coemansia pectinata]
MTSYSFGDASATLMDGTGATSAATGPYDSSRAYRRDSGIAGTCDYQHSGPSPNTAAGISTGEDSFADYLFRQQQPQQSSSSSSDISSVVAAVAAAAHTSAGNCGAPGISIFHQDSPLLHSSSASAYAPRTSFSSYSAHRYQDAVAAMSNNQSPSAATVALPSASMPAASLTTTPSPNSVALGPLDTLGSTPSSTSSASTASCLADPLPSFLSSLPTPMESSKYSSLVAGIASANNSSAILATAAPTGTMAGPNSASNLLAAAAAAAAAVVSSASATPVGALSGNPSSGSHANTSAGSYSHYSAQHQHSHNHGNGYTAHHGHGHHYSAAHNNAYDVSTLSLSHSSAISASTPSLSAQVVAAAALAQGAGSAGPSAQDLHSYSISAFSRPLSQSSPTSAAMITSEAATTLAANAAGNNNSFAGIGQVLTQPSAQYSQPPYQQQRSYSDYSAYYRSPSATMGLGTGSTTATGASPMSGTGMNPTVSTGTSAGNTTQLAAAAAAAAAAMGSSYYASAAAYQPYMRPGGNSNAYYYAQPQSRYLPYSAYPPIRHFVSPARPFKCETCDQSFSRNHDLKRHVKIHSGVKPHKCPKCGKSFGRSDALKRHSMVKRCRSSATATTAKSTPAPPPAQIPAQGISSQRMPQQLGSQRFEPNARLSIHPQLHHVQQQQQAHSMMQQGVGSSGTVMTSVPSSSRLAPVAGSMFGQGGGSGASAMTMSASTNSIVSSMLSSRTNTI